MEQVKLRVRTPEGVTEGRYAVSDPTVLLNLECPVKGLRALEQAIYASGLYISPWDVHEAIASTVHQTYRYTLKEVTA